ncbi:hypothetical protein Ancab_010171 [Ancistrocladus abbreviatus]
MPSRPPPPPLPLPPSPPQPPPIATHPQLLQSTEQLPPPSIVQSYPLPGLHHHHHHHHHHHRDRLIPPVTGVTVSCSLFLLLVVFFRKLLRRRTSPTSNTNLPCRFSYSTLRRATSGFSPAGRIGQGGFGAVYSATISTANNRKADVAVKLMDSGSLQGEREFHNEIVMANKLVDSDRVVKLLGFASDRKRRRMCLVYELMRNGNLQECLLHKKCEELMDWNKRFQIALEVSRGLAFLHHECDPPIIHGDIKPSNVLLDDDFSSKIGDFGLARFKLVDQCEVVINLSENDAVKKVDDVKKRGELESNIEDNGSVAEETESVMSVLCFDEGGSTGVERSPENFTRVTMVETSPEMVTALPSPSECWERSSGSVLEGQFVKGGGGNGKGVTKSEKMKDVLAKGGFESGKVKDYVMEWIDAELDKERSNGDWIGASSSNSGATGGHEKKKKKSKKSFEWWVSIDEGMRLKKEKRKPVREWWKEEYAEELARKKKKKKKQQQAEMSDDNQDIWWPRDDNLYQDRKKSRSRRSSRGSIDWWLDGLSGEHWKVHHTSSDSISGEIPKSGGISSTPSMRGTVCYVAPEYSAGGDPSEKCDVYSYGVLLLVLIAGRRPLQVTSPVTDYHRANLISWARRLARGGKLLDLIDKRIHSLNNEQAQLCITVALLCIQKSPGSRPSMKEVVGMLTGELMPPALPIEYSPSTPSRFPFKSQKKVRPASKES